MWKVLIVFVFVSSLQMLYAQLDPQYHGTYFNEDLSSSFTIYSLDETSEHCFFVDYEEYVDLDQYVLYSGTGHCDDSEGMKAEFYIDEFKGTVYARLEKDADGELIMFVRFPNSTDEKMFIFAGHMDDVYDEELSLTDEFLFEREDGATFLLFDESGQIAFTLTGNPNCVPNTITGILLPEDEEMTILSTTIEGCTIRVLSSEKGVQINEENCSKFHKKCAPWEGFYLFK